MSTLLRLTYELTSKPTSCKQSLEQQKTLKQNQDAVHVVTLQSNRSSDYSKLLWQIRMPNKVSSKISKRTTTQSAQIL